MLTDTEIRKSKLRRLADGGGLYLLTTPAGGRLWRWKYRFEGREKLMSFGQYPDVPLVAARALHAAARRLLASGVDPMAARKAVSAPVAESFEAVARLWLEHWKNGKSEQHVAATTSRLEVNVFPHFGRRPIGEIKAPDLVKMVKAIEGRGVVDLAKRALGTTGQVFRYGIAHGHCERNPAAEIKPSDLLQPRKVTHLARVDESRLPLLLRSIEIYRGAVLTRLALKLMCLTFVRTSELIGAPWCEFDVPAARWNIPAERMKMDTPHIVPLSTQALEVLELIRMVSGDNPQLFPGEQGAATMSNNTLLYALYRMGYKGDMTGHGFRGVASTILHEQGWPHEHIELQLAHTKRDAVSAAYDHARYLKPRAEMMQAWGDYLERMVRG